MKTILITGSSRGIGRAIARLAHEQDYQVIVHGRTDSDELRKINKELEGSIKTFFDVSDKKAVDNAFKDLASKVKNIDALVNNVGSNHAAGKLEELTEKKMKQDYQTNILGHIFCIQAILPIMKKGGSIVNITSIRAIKGMESARSIAYSAHKAGLSALTTSLAKYLANKKIRVNEVAPGHTETEFAKVWAPGTREKVEENNLIKRIAQPEDIAEAVMFLASEKAGFITGQTILVDGGYSIGGK